MKKFLSIFLAIFLICAMLPTAMASSGELTQLPVVTATSAADITSTTATLNGTLTVADAAAMPYAVGFSISPSDNLQEATAYPLSSFEEGNLSVSVKDLKPNTSYAFSVYYYPTEESGAEDVVWAAEAKNFTTLADVATGDYELISTSTENKVLYADVALNGSTSSTGATLYIEYKATDAEVWTRTEALTADENGNFSQTVKIQADLSYQYRALADNTANGGAINNGEIKELSLQIDPEISKVNATNIKTNSATLNANIKAGTNDISKVGFLYRVKGEEGFTKVELDYKKDGKYSQDISNLKSNTTYEFYAYVTVGDVAALSPEAQPETLYTFTTAMALNEALNPDDFLDYEAQKYIIYASCSTGGTVSPSGSTAVKAGEAMAVYIEPQSGYSIADVTVDGASVGAITSYLFTDVRANHTIYVTFEKTSATVSPTPTQSPSIPSTIVPPTGLAIPYTLCAALMGSGLLMIFKKRK